MPCLYESPTRRPLYWSAVKEEEEILVASEAAGRQLTDRQYSWVSPCPPAAIKRQSVLYKILMPTKSCLGRTLSMQLITQIYGRDRRPYEEDTDHNSISGDVDIMTLLGLCCRTCSCSALSSSKRLAGSCKLAL